MWINEQIANHALLKCGQEPLNENDRQTNSAKYRYIQEFYLPTILETLSKTEWTSRIKRTALVRIDDGENLSSYQFRYVRPIDCAKPVSLESEKEYLIEGEIIYTDDENPILRYVSNGYVGKDRFELANPQPTEETWTASGLPYYTYDEETDTYEYYPDWEDGHIWYVPISDDYWGYDDIELDPQLSEYIETRLAAKLALKMTGDLTMYNLLYSESVIKEKAAAESSIAQAHNKDKGNRYWSDILGLPEYK